MKILSIYRSGLIIISLKQIRCRLKSVSYTHLYGSEKNWETVRQFALEAALTRTDAVIQPRQSNTWGALSLDHVYEDVYKRQPISRVSTVRISIVL